MHLYVTQSLIVAYFYKHAQDCRERILSSSRARSQIELYLPILCRNRVRAGHRLQLNGARRAGRAGGGAAGWAGRAGRRAAGGRGAACARGSVAPRAVERDRASSEPEPRSSDRECAASAVCEPSAVAGCQ